MCVKQSKGCRIAEGDLDPNVFHRLAPVFPHIKSIVFTGIGEPLLNEGLEYYISEAKKKMPDTGTTGFQTNGKLLTADRAQSLINAGLDRICISVDTVTPAQFDAFRQGGSFIDVETAFDNLKMGLNNNPDIGLKKGIEFVLMKKNMDELPQVVLWAAKKGVDFIIVTHLTAYESALEKEMAFMNNSDAALDLFEKYRKKAEAWDIDITQYDKMLWKWNKNEADVELYTLVQAMKDEALEQDLFINLFHLLDEDTGYHQQIRLLFDEAKSLASRYGITLTLPEIRPKTNRQCAFTEDNSMFVTWDGKVSPCYFLWHQYDVMRQGYVKNVTPVYFGNLQESDPITIWNSDEFKTFREKVKKYDYPNCQAWCETRCDYVLDAPFYQDCFINDIPCCDCFWGLGLLNCLR